MKFLIQSDETVVSIDNYILKNYINESHIHTFTEVSLQELKECNSLEYKDYIPIGTLDFVGEHLSKYHKIHSMNPIEIPEVLRKSELLCRNYTIVDKGSLPKQGKYFLKNVSKLKTFTYLGDISQLPIDKLSNALYSVSDVVDIVSEYRCFVSDDMLVAVNNYSGNPLAFPDPKIIQKLILLYISDSLRPKAYTMDVAVLADGRTCIIEIHPWICVGLYGYLFDANLPYYYAEGYAYYKNVNKKLTRS